jgi:Fic family protein
VLAMVYVYIKTNGKDKYYYLRIDKRVNGKKIVKDIQYLGKDVSKIDINKLLDHKLYGSEIRKSYKTINKFLTNNYYINKIKKLKLKKNKYLSTDEIVKLESIKLHFKSRFNRLDDITKKEILDNFIISYTYNTTSIEGNTIPLINVKKILSNQKFNLTSKPREIYDLRNTKNTFPLVYSKSKLTKKFIIEIHKNLLKDMDERVDFRNYDVRVTKSHFDSAPYFRIEKELDELLNWYNQSEENAFVKAVIFHHKFEKIHPFADGNGRTGRILLNYILIKDNYPPIIITRKNRSDYIDTLSIVDKGNYKPLISFILNEYISNYWSNFLI